MKKTFSFALGGGLDLSTPAIAITPGKMIASYNYEVGPRGYRRIDGLERFDGHPKPSQASYWYLNVDNGSGAIATGATVTGNTSGATGYALLGATITSGTYVDSSAVGWLVLTNVVGTFVNNEQLKVGGVAKFLLNGTAALRGALNDTNDTTYYRAAVDLARTYIGAPTGSGSIRGVWVYNGDVYCWRDNAGATAGGMFKATTAGWVAQSLGYSLSFASGGTYEVLEGDTLTGATSTATAVVGRIVLDSGSWAGGDAAGRFILTSRTGDMVSETLNVGANTNVCTITGNSTANTLPAGGRYECENFNFYGASDLLRVYGANGVGKAFEWDGAVFVPIVTGMGTDTPNHLTINASALFLSFPGGSLQFSGVGEPYVWNVVIGAGEIGLGSDITGLIGDNSGVTASGGMVSSMSVFARNKIATLYGSTSSDYDLTTITDESGAIEWTVQRIGTPLYLDDRGVRSVTMAGASGDFKLGTITGLIDPIFATKRADGVTAVGSCVVKSKNQYRLFFSDGTGVSVYFGNKNPECTLFDLSTVVTCVCSGEDSSGNEIIFFGSDDGYVYQLDAGTSFDGVTLPAFARLAFADMQSHTVEKRWHKVTLELDAPATASIGLTAEFSYADSGQPAVSNQSFTVSAGGGFWNESRWNEFYWSSPVNGLANAYIEGIGTNISLTVASSTIYDEPHTLQSVTYQYSPRNLVR
jgi:hypothetical protein